MVRFFVLMIASAAVLLQISPLQTVSARFVSRLDPQASMTTEPSLADTIKWLTTKLTEVRSAHTATGTSLDKKGNPIKRYQKIEYNSFRVVSVKSSTCSLEISSKDIEDTQFTVSGNRITSTRTSIRLVELDKVVFVALRPRPYPSVPGYSSSPEATNQLILEAEGAGFRGRDVMHYSDDASTDLSDDTPARLLSFEIDDQQLGARLVKAISHAVQLCKTQPTKAEPF